MELEEICKVAEEVFDAQIVRAKIRPQFHDQFREKYMLGVLAHVSTHCYGAEGMTPAKVERSVRSQWPIKLVKERLHALHKAATPPPRKPVPSEHRAGRQSPFVGRVIWASGGGTGCNGRLG